MVTQQLLAVQNFVVVVAAGAGGGNDEEERASVKSGIARDVAKNLVSMGLTITHYLWFPYLEPMWFGGMCGAAYLGSLRDEVEVREGESVHQRCIVEMLIVVEMARYFAVAVDVVLFQSCPILQSCGTCLDTVDIQVAKLGTFELGIAAVDERY